MTTPTPTMSLEELEATLTDIQNESPDKPANEPSQIKDAPKSAASALDLREFVNADQLKRDVEFDTTDLDNACRSQAPMFVTYANLARLARRQFERMKVTVDVMESRLYAVHREQMVADGKKPTEASVDAAVKGDPRWYAAQQKLIDARAIYDLANDARNAFEHRKDMLVQMTVDRRREREGDLRIATAEAAQRAVGNSREAVLKHLSNQAQSA